MNAVFPNRRRDGVAGVAMLAMLPLSLAPAVAGWPLWPAGLCAWLAGLGLWSRTGAAQRRQFAILVGTGLACTAVAVALGEPLPAARLLAQNQGLLAMLAAVTFLRLVALPSTDPQAESAPGGAGGYLKTALGLHLFGAVINLSALVMVGDRLQARGPLGRAQAVLLSRGFASAAFWSPFFAAMATALTYAPGARFSLLLLAGLPLAALALAVGLVDARQRDPQRLQDFRGYPVGFDSLWLPALLAAAVVVSHRLVPDWSVPSLITLLTPTLSLAVLGLRIGAAGAVRRFGDHARRSLPDMYGELVLFLGAGVLGAGLIVLGAALRQDLPPVALTPGALSLALLGMVGVALLGVHPVVSIAAVTALFGPQSDPTPMAVAFLAAWGIGASAGPLTGIHLLIQGRYGIPGTTMMRWNLVYTLVMSAAALAAINLLPVWRAG